MRSSSVGRVLHEKAKQFHWSGQGSMSVKSFYNGTAEYRLNSGTAKVDSQRYLLLNDNQPYTITIDSTSEVESFCVFFTPHHATRGAFEMVSTVDRILEDPFFVPSQSAEFIDKTYWHDDVVTPILHTFRADFPVFGSDPIWLDEQLCTLLNHMLILHTDVLLNMDKIPSIRTSTREELFRRVSLANELVMERFRDTLTINDLAHEAALSANHLIRTYKQVFGVTPHQHIVSLRIKEAGRLLRKTEMPVSDICSAVGFESLGSFSTAFQRETGNSPLKYRKLGDF